MDPLRGIARWYSVLFTLASKTKCTQFVRRIIIAFGGESGLMSRREGQAKLMNACDGPGIEPGSIVDMP